MRSVIFGTNAAVFTRDELAISRVKTDLEQDTNGAIVVNQSLAATSSVFVAGDDASVYLEAMGRGTFSGEEHCTQTAVVAASNIMGDETEYREVPVLDYNIPDAGVHMTLVGNCSAAFNSYGYWWKEPVRRGSSSGGILNSNGSNGEKSAGYFSNWVSGGSRKTSRQKKDGIYGNAKTVRISDTEVNRSFGSKSPVYGEGVLFYMDGDMIVGILISTDLSSVSRSKMLESVKRLIGKKITTERTEGVLSEQYTKYQWLSDAAVNDILASDEPSDLSRLSSPCIFQYTPASRATIRALNSNTQNLGPSVPQDLSFAEGNSTNIAASEATSAAYRKGLVNRTRSFT